MHEVAIRLNTCGKALACTGSVVLGNATVRNMLLNYAGSLVNTTAPSFPSVAVIRAAYNLMRTGATQKAQDNIQHLVKYFFESITSIEEGGEKGKIPKAAQEIYALMAAHA